MARSHAKVFDLEPLKPKGVYGTPPDELVSVPAGALQVSPLMPGSQALEECCPSSLGGMTVLAPPGTLERRYTIALSLKAVAPDVPFTVLAPKDKGGSRLGKELRAFGCGFTETARRHHRICAGASPGDPVGLDEAIAAGAPRLDRALGLWTQPGVFSWNRVDPGSALLMRNLPPLSGRGADFGCGIGVLAHAILASPKVEHLTMIDIDRRATALALRNVQDPRAETLWADLRSSRMPGGLAFVVMNPPFHDGGVEDQALGRTFIRRAAEALRPGGTCWLVANRHLPYEAELKAHFRRVAPIVEAEGYKIYEAQR
jgi:16S rRNA (guanine1207-N2)-methyltransferase